MKKSCKKGYYYCFTSKKCKKIPVGHHVMPSGRLMKDNEHEESNGGEESTETKKNGNGSNGNGGAVNEAKEKDHEVSMAKTQVKKSIDNLQKVARVLAKKTDDDNLPAWVQAKLTDTEHNTDAAASYMTGKEDLDEGRRDGKSAKDKDYSLRDWFKGGGWVQTGGKYDGKPCAKQPGQKTKPFCRDADDRAAMSKDERERRVAKKRREDPNPDRKGKAKMVTASYEPEGSIVEQQAQQANDPKLHPIGQKVGYEKNKPTKKSGQKPGIANIDTSELNKNPLSNDPIIRRASRSNSSYSNVYYDEETVSEKCWDGYKQLGMKKKGKKTVPNCVKEGHSNWREELQEKIGIPTGPGTPFKDPDDAVEKLAPKYGGGKVRPFTPVKQASTGDSLPRTCVNVGNQFKGKAGMMSQKDIDACNKGIGPTIQGTIKLQKAHYEPEGEQLDEIAPAVALGLAAAAAAPWAAKKFLKPKADKAIQRGRDELHLQGKPFGAGARGLDTQSYEPEGEVVSEKKDACYKKVKSRYKVWPSAYASGALVKCRKVGAANWGNKTKKENFSNWRDEMLFEGWEDKLGKMTPAQIADLKKANPGAAEKIDSLVNKMRSATPTPQGTGPQLPTINRADYASRNQPNSAWQRAQQNPSGYRAGPGVKPDFSGVKPQPPRPSGIKPPQAKPGLFSRVMRIAKPVVRAGARFAARNPRVAAALTTGALVAGAVRLATSQNKNTGYQQQLRRESVSIENSDGKTFAEVIDIIGPAQMQTVTDQKGVWAGTTQLSNWRDELSEDWQKVNRKDKTDGMSQKAVNAYKRENPGSKLKTAVTEKNPTGKRAERRKNFCSRSNGQRKMHNIDCSKTPEKKICKARKRWRC